MQNISPKRKKGTFRILYFKIRYNDTITFIFVYGAQVINTI